MKICSLLRVHLGVWFFAILMLTPITSVAMPSSLDELRRAQSLFAQGQYHEMHKVLIDLLESQTPEPSVIRAAYKLAATYYGTTPDNFYIEAKYYSFILSKKTEDNKKPMFVFDFSGYCDRDNPIVKVEVQLPDKSKKVVYSKDSKKAEVYPRDNNIQLVVRSKSEPMDMYLPIGVYRWIVVLKDGTKQNFPLILNPNNNVRTPDITIEDQKAHLVIRPSDDRTRGLKRSYWYIEGRRNATQPFNSHEEDIAGWDVYRKSIPLLGGDEPKKIHLSYYESLSGRGAPGISYFYERILNLE